MFFIGATGHLVTLLLTVVLPLIFFYSGQQRLPDLQEQVQVTKQVQFEQKNHNDYSVETEFCAVVKQHKIQFKECKCLCGEILPPKFLVLWKTPVLFYSGNKAPPVLLC